MKRSKFLKLSILSVSGVITLQSCFASPESKGLITESNEEEESRLTLTNITNNHGHETISLSINDIQTSNTKMFFLSGGTHNHEVNPSRMELKNLQDGEVVVFGVYLSQTHYHSFRVQLRQS